MYIQDFCDSVQSILPQRTDFVKALKDIEDQETFTETCLSLQADTLRNSWFDPIDPQASITQQEICDLHFELFSQLAEKQRTSLSEYVSFSYLASLDLFVNANMQEDFENCINLEVVEQPNQWATNFVTTNPVFLAWDSDAKLQVAAEAAQSIVAGCPGITDCAATGSCSGCAGCSLGIAFIYKAFEMSLNQKFAEEFKAYSVQMFNEL